MKDFRLYRWAIFSIICILYFFVCLHRLSPTVIARDLALSFHADAVTLGIIASAYFYLYAAMQPVVGYLSDTTGPRKVMSLMFFISAAGSIIFGLAPNATMAILGRALIGAGLAGIFIPALKLFSRWYRPNQFTSLTGVMSTVNGLGGLSAAMPLTYLVVLLGWRGSFVAIGLLSTVLAILAWVIVLDAPEDRGWPALTAEDTTIPRTGEGIRLSKRFVTVFGNLDFCLISLAVFLFWGGAVTFQGLWAVPYLMDVFILNKVWAGWILMAWPLGFAVGGPFIGFLTDRLNLNHKKTLLWSLGLGMSAWILMMVLRERDHLMLVVPLFFIFGLIAGGMNPLTFTIIRDLFPFRLMGTATGLMNAAGFFGSAVYMPFTGYLLNGAASAHPGSYSFEAYRTLFIVFLISFAGALIATALISNRKVSRTSLT